MTALPGDWSDFGMDTISLAGPLEAKLAAIRDAGFTQVMLSAGDLAGHAAGVNGALAAVRSSGLRVTAFQGLRDFEGLSGAFHAHKVDVARSLVAMCGELGAPVLVATSSALEPASRDLEVVARDLRKLAMIALPFDVKVAYVALSWGRAVSDFATALDVVGRADMPNLGIGIDSFHALAANSPLADLDCTLADTILTVQLSDFLAAELPSREERIATATHLRVFPGEGMHSAQLADLIRRLDLMGYAGAYSFQVFNDDYHEMDPAQVAARARRSAIWLGEEVLQRAVPQPASIPLRPPRERAA